jgi:hypothetical protein
MLRPPNVVKVMPGHIKADEHAILMLGNAGWSHGTMLAEDCHADVPDGVCSGAKPGRKCVDDLRSHQLSNQVFENDDPCPTGLARPRAP